MPIAYEPFDVSGFSSLGQLNRGWKRHVKEHKIAVGQDRGYQLALNEFRARQRELETVQGIAKRLHEQPFIVHSGTVTHEVYDGLHELFGLQGHYPTLQAEREGPTLSQRILAPHIAGNIRYEDNGRVSYTLIFTPAEIQSPQRKHALAAVDIARWYDRHPNTNPHGHISAETFPYLVALLGVRDEQVYEESFDFQQTKGHAIKAPHVIGMFKPEGNGMDFTMWRPSHHTLPAKPQAEPSITPVPVTKSLAKQTTSSSDHWVRDTLDILEGIIDGRGIDSSDLDAIRTDLEEDRIHGTIGRFINEHLLPNYQLRYDAVRNEISGPRQKNKNRTSAEEGWLHYRQQLIEDSLDRLAAHSLSFEATNRRSAVLLLSDTKRLLEDVENRLNIRHTNDTI